MSDLDDDLFGSGSSDGGDTDDLIAEAKSSKKKPSIAKKKKIGGKKVIGKKKIGKKKKVSKNIPDADAPSDDEEGLFDDSDDDDDKKPSASSDSSSKKSSKKPMSRREKMEALQKKARAAAAGSSEPKKSKRKKNKEGEEDGKSGDQDDDDDDARSVDSADIALTKEDHDFIDSEDDDEDARRELYAEQHFDDERPEDIADFVDNSDGRKIKMGGSRGSGGRRRRGPDAVSEDEGEDTQNPIMQAVRKMKKKKREQRKAGEVEEEVKNLIDAMENAADDDLEAFKAKRPATRKLALLPQVVDMLVKKDTMRVMLDCDVLATLKRWIQPLPNGKLGNVTIRSRIIETVATMNGSDGITSYDLKRSEFGKAVMGLYMHPQETPTLKRQLKSLIEQWSRPIFSKSGNMRDLEQAHATRNSQMPYAMQQQQQQRSSPSASRHQQQRQDLNSLISSGKRKRDDGGVQRVRVPFSKGFQFTVRPEHKSGTVSDPARASSEKRSALAKRMVEKARPASKNNRSANISVEGRQVK